LQGFFKWINDIEFFFAQSSWIAMFLPPSAQRHVLIPFCHRHLLIIMATIWSASPSFDFHCHLVTDIVFSPSSNCHRRANSPITGSEKNSAKTGRIQGGWFVQEKIPNQLRTIRYISPDYKLSKCSIGYEYMHMALRACHERVSFHIRNLFIDLNVALLMLIFIVSDMSSLLWISIVYDQNHEIDVSDHLLATGFANKMYF
jgi:hypothetical protein